MCELSHQCAAQTPPHTANLASAAPSYPSRPVTHISTRCRATTVTSSEVRDATVT